MVVKWEEPDGFSLDISGLGSAFANLWDSCLASFNTNCIAVTRQGNIQGVLKKGFWIEQAFDGFLTKVGADSAICSDDGQWIEDCKTGMCDRKLGEGSV